MTDLLREANITNYSFEQIYTPSAHQNKIFVMCKKRILW
jgi:hypothetical protein